jgi:precorrin-8X/cobalt-precorrin-8 methylmutase
VSPHPIEEESYRRLEALAVAAGLDRLGPGARAVAARVLHATVDPALVRTLVLDESAVAAGAAALAAGAPVVTDVEMVRAGVTAAQASCFLGKARAGAEGVPTRSAAAIDLAVERFPDGAVFAVGCAPTALERLLDHLEAGRVRPALVVGVPVGLVGAAEAKERCRAVAAGRCAALTNRGERGGSPVAAAIVNALGRLARDGRAAEDLV